MTVTYDASRVTLVDHPLVQDNDRGNSGQAHQNAGRRKTRNLNRNELGPDQRP